VFALAAAIALAGCSGVPTRSKPQVIGPIASSVAPSAAPVVSPAPGLDPRAIVQGFLAANVSEDARHSGARNFLTVDAAKKWSDTAASSIVTNLSTHVADDQTHTVSVTAKKVGTLDVVKGIYTPVITGDTQTNPTFGLIQVNGQWRINQLGNGLIIDQTQFQNSFKPRPIYFFDQTQQLLVADLRYSTLTDQSLCSWLLEQLGAGPRPELQPASTSDVPDQTAHASVVYDITKITIDLPGSSQLDAKTKTRLAAQLANTFHLDLLAPPIELMDGAKPVSIPQVGSPFGLASVPAYTTTPVPPDVYYVRDGDVIRSGGSKVAGEAGSSGQLVSIAVAQRDGSSGMPLLAATRGKPDAGELVVGPLGGPLVKVDVPAGPLSRPAWTPGLKEVWVGDGTKLMRVVLNQPVKAVGLATASGSPAGQIRSVAISPDGVRIALIIKAADESSQLWIGTIVRSTGDAVTIESLAPITPIGRKLSDVAWNDASTLYTIGVDAVGTPSIWSVQIDGSLLTSRSTAGLPSAPDSITTSQSGLPWVSANTAVWEQAGQESSWTSPSGPGTTLGSFPTYVE
jgi:hypothetical protein